jgi:hypothetical protein
VEWVLPLRQSGNNESPHRQKPVINPIAMLAPDLRIPPLDAALLETAPLSFTAPTPGVRPCLATCGSSDLAELYHLLAHQAALEMPGTTSITRFAIVVLAALGVATGPAAGPHHSQGDVG